MENYIQIINDYEELYSKIGETFVLVGTIKNRQHKKYSMLAVGIRARQQKKIICAGGWAPASRKGHFYWVKVAGGCCVWQQRHVLAARTNGFSCNHHLISQLTTHACVQHICPTHKKNSPWIRTCSKSRYDEANESYIWLGCMVVHACDWKNMPAGGTVDNVVVYSS